MKRFFAWLLSVLTVISCLNMTVFAQEPTNEKQTEATSVQSTEEKEPQQEDIIYIEDSLFKIDLLAICDDNYDGEIQVSEAESLYGLSILGNEEKMSIKGLRYFKNIEGIYMKDFNIQNIQEIEYLDKLTRLRLINCGLKQLPNLKNRNLTEVNLDDNYLSYDEIRSKLPAQILDAECLEIAKRQKPYYREIISNGAALSGMILPDAVLDAVMENGAWNIRVSRLGEAYAPENVTLSLPAPANGNVASVTYNGEELEFNAVDDRIVFPFSGNGVYAYSVQEEPTASEPVTEEPTVSEDPTEPVAEKPTAAEPVTKETTTVAVSVPVTTAGSSGENPSTGDSSAPYKMGAALFLTGIIGVIAARKRKVKA